MCNDERQGTSDHRVHGGAWCIIIDNRRGWQRNPIRQDVRAVVVVCCWVRDGCGLPVTMRGFQGLDPNLARYL